MDTTRDSSDPSEYEIIGDIAGLTDITEHINQLSLKIKEPIKKNSLYQKIMDYVREL